MTALRAFLACVLAVATFAVAAPGRAADANPAASSYMQTLGEQAIAELTDPAVPQPEREARFRRMLDEHFDMMSISKFVLGRYWRTATEQQRVEFRQLFEDFLVSSYSARFAEYRGQGFEVRGSTVDGGVTIVHSRIDMPSSEDIRVDWRLRGKEDRYAIVDIIVEGVSMAVTQRSEFASVIQGRGGVEGLLEALRAKQSQAADNSDAAAQ
jgi:phospholipid transport system substrate-binding protein